MSRSDAPVRVPDDITTGSMATIRLLVPDDANRRVLDEWLAESDDWTVVTGGGPPSEAADVCLVDVAGLRAHRSELAQWKDESDALRPVLLVSEQGEAALDDDGSALVNDVVALPTSEAALQRRLDRLLAEREQALQLAADRTVLREQNERLKIFAARVAHDIRNPLGIAMGYLEQARSTDEGDHFDVVENALGRIEQLIDETLLLAKMGQTAIDLEPMRLESTARRAWTQVETGEGTLVVADDAEFEADESRVQELFENLYRNAAEHVGGAVTVTVGVLDDGDGFYVADDGPGIPASDREQVFEIGYTTREEGTGFGLRIVREIAEAHGWTVTVTESADGGARFEVSCVTFDGDEA